MLGISYFPKRHLEETEYKSNLKVDINPIPWFSSHFLPKQAFILPAPTSHYNIWWTAQEKPSELISLRNPHGCATGARAGGQCADVIMEDCPYCSTVVKYLLAFCQIHKYIEATGHSRTENTHHSIQIHLTSTKISPT